LAETKPPLASVAEIRQAHAAEDAARQEEARRLYQQGLTAIAQGKTSAARYYLRLAVAKSTGDLRGDILAQLAVLGSGERPPQVARD
jgi:outer membrane protein assembly factor BamD (BamD/ComL family)